MRKARHLLQFTLVSAIVIVGAYWVLIWFWQRSLLYPAPPLAGFSSRPADAQQIWLDLAGARVAAPGRRDDPGIDLHQRASVRAQLPRPGIPGARSVRQSCRGPPVPQAAADPPRTARRGNPGAARPRAGPGSAAGRAAPAAM